MDIRKAYIDISNCLGCQGCKHYPYFHYIPIIDNKENKSGKEADLQYTKFDKNHSEVINHTTGVTHIYNGIEHKWKQKG